MNRKILTIFLIAALLIIAAGAVSAADSQDDSKSISVKINWDDAAKISERPNQVSVNLIKDDSVVDTVVLKESNSWNANFKAQDDGTFKVQASDLNDYSMEIKGDADAGFIVTYTLKADVLGASDDAAVVEEADNDAVEQNDESGDDAVVGQDIESDDAVIGEDNETVDDTNTTNVTENETAAEGDVDDTNATDDEEISDENATNDETSVDSAPKTTSDNKNPVNKENVKKVVKPLKKNNVTKQQLRHTGIPLMILVVAAMASVFVPFSRRKN